MIERKRGDHPTERSDPMKAEYVDTMCLSNREVLTAPEAAAVLRVGRTTMYRLINSGEIRSIKIGRKVLIPRTFIREFIEKRAQLCYNDSQIDSRSCCSKGDCSNESNRKPAS